MPCSWISDNLASRYEDNDKKHWSVNPGRVANSYHDKFSKEIGCNTLEEIEQAKQMGAQIINGVHGFHARNTNIAKSDYLIAFTWSNSNTPIAGGTLDTWNKCTSHKIHVSLYDLTRNKL